MNDQNHNLRSRCVNWALWVTGLGSLVWLLRNNADYALHDDGVDTLVNLMESKGTYFYQTAAHPGGIVGANDIVVIKVNNQWGHIGYDDGVGRLATNNDPLVLK